MDRHRLAVWFEVRCVRVPLSDRVGRFPFPDLPRKEGGGWVVGLRTHTHPAFLCVCADRALAEAWEATPYAPLSTFSSPLGSISLFVLLDLLGAVGPNVPSYFQTTHWAYQRMAALEERMRKLQVLSSSPAGHFLPEAGKAAAQFSRGFVEDDHVPFMARGVEILHIIPHPFPSVWHTMADTGANLDIPTVDDWAKIVTAFTAEWMELDGLLPKLPARRDAREAKTEL